MLSNSQMGLENPEIDLQLSSLVPYNMVQGISAYTTSSEKYCHDDNECRSSCKEFAEDENCEHFKPDHDVETLLIELVSPEQAQFQPNNESLTGFVDDWTDDIEDLFQSEQHITDFGPVLAGHDALVSPTQFDDLLLPPTEDCSSQQGSVQLSRVTSDIDIQLETNRGQGLSDASCQLFQTTYMAESDLAVARTIKAHNVKERPSKRRLLSESKYDSDEDSQHSDNHTPSQEALVEFARDFIERDKHSKSFFWQYNLQSRGPKSQRLCKQIENEDSHVVPDFADPVFESNQHIYSWKHIGRARQGDGNDLHPDPMKLLAIGLQIRSLEAEFHSIKAASEGNEDSTSSLSAHKRKNKLASRICRLKKKAMHAANKIKLDGLKREHGQLMRVIKGLVAGIKECMATKPWSASFCQTLDEYIRKHLTFMIAGHTTEYVNTELEKNARMLLLGEQF